VANAGGAGNTRSDLDAAYGTPAGETPERLVVYRKNNFEYHVRFVPDPQGRAALLVAIPQPNSPPQLEANDQFVVERYTSQSLAQALPPDAFTSNKGQPGQFLVVYVRDAQQQNRITRFIIGPGNDPQALINQGR
jgi:hypothetical protein